MSCLLKHTPAQQVTYYQSGIGTYDKGGLTNGIAAGMDMAVGSGLGTHVKDAYSFLMQHYRSGDKICLLGFSRGAYTVRCLSGMLHKVGLLPASNGSQINFAYNFYKDETAEGKKLAEGFKHTFCTHVDVYFLGLWDCVASVGFFPRKLPLSKCPPANTVRFVRHAMALDERRAKFKVCQWNQEDPDDVTTAAGVEAGAEGGVAPDSGRAKVARLQRKAHDGLIQGQSTTLQATENEKQHPAAASPAANTDNNNNSGNGTIPAAITSLADRRRHERRHRHDFPTDVLEVWFKGTHADVGGGSVVNESRHMLSRIPLRWMIRQCFECDTGILFDTERLAQLGLDVHGLYPVYTKLDRSELDQGGGVPVQGLMRKYTAGVLAPLQRRSTVLNIERDWAKDDRRHAHDGVAAAASSSGPAGPTARGDQQAMDMAQYILPSEAAEDYFDSREPPSDMLNNKKFWWVLELWPVKIRVLVEDHSAWAKKVRLNLGRHRAIRQTEPKLHWTVRRLIDNKEYKLKGRVTKGTRWQDVV